MTPRERAIELANWMSRHMVGEKFAAKYEACDGCIAEAERTITEAVAAQREALEVAKETIEGHFDDNCEECRNALAIVNKAIRTGAPSDG